MGVPLNSHHLSSENMTITVQLLESAPTWFLKWRSLANPEKVTDGSISEVTTWRIGFHMFHCILWKLIQYLVGNFNPFEKYARQIGWFPQVGLKIKRIWNHHLECQLPFQPDFIPTVFFTHSNQRIPTPTSSLAEDKWPALRESLRGKPANLRGLEGVYHRGSGISKPPLRSHDS